MGYACPVCDAPQADGEHLANHLAFTAMLHEDDHAAFLDAHITDWADRKPPELAAELIRHADRAEYDAVFEDTTTEPRMGHGGSESVDPSPATPDVAPDFDALDDESVDEETQRVIEEARKLFEQGSVTDEEE